MKEVNKKLEEFEQYIREKKVAIIGLGVSNIPLLDYLHNLKANITVFDKREINEIDKNILDKITEYGISFSFGNNYLSKLIGFDIIFRSPSCRPDLPEIQKELENGAILTSEIEMLIELCPGKVIGITGSDGKTTTTTLIYEVLKQNGYNCYLGGNIGIPLFTKVHEMTKDDIVVLELSSFQLLTMKISPKISVITNITPNHLDIHKSYEEYIEAKENIMKYQDGDSVVVLNYDNDITKELGKKAKGIVRYFSSKTKLDEGYIVDGDVIKYCENKIRKHVINTSELLLRGKHMYEDVVAALSATKDFVDDESAINVIKNFKGVEHRLEFVRELDGVKWYNDSIGTSPTRTIAGLQSFDEKIVLIAGGYDKHLDYTPLAKPILDNVSSLILIGQTAEKIENAVKIEAEKENKEIPIYHCISLEETIATAKKVAKNGEIVLLSPASAAFDMFKNFAERGKIYKELVNKL